MAAVAFPASSPAEQPTAEALEIDPWPGRPRLWCFAGRRRGPAFAGLADPARNVSAGVCGFRAACRQAPQPTGCRLADLTASRLGWSLAPGLAAAPHASQFSLAPEPSACRFPQQRLPLLAAMKATGPRARPASNLLVFDSTRPSRDYKGSRKRKLVGTGSSPSKFSPFLWRFGVASRCGDLGSD